MKEDNLWEYCKASIEIKKNGGFKNFKTNIYNNGYKTGYNNGVADGIFISIFAFSVIDDYFELGIKEKIATKLTNLKKQIEKYIV